MNSDARSSRRSSVRGRALLALGAIAAAAGMVLVAFAVEGGPDGDAAVLEVEDAVAAATPSTIPTIPTTPTSTAVPGNATPVTTEVVSDPDGSEVTPPASAPVAISPLAERLGEQGSAIPPEIEPRVRPVGLRIDEIFVDDPVRAVGLEDDGELEVPGATEIGWYRYGAAPGRPGATVLAAHVTWNGDYGPFLNLGDLAPGDRVSVGLEDGTERTYEVIERTMYDKDELPRERIWRTTGDETLVLITCGGDFNPDISRYRQNIVVYAVPVA